MLRFYILFLIPSVSLKPSKDQAYNGAAVMSSEAGVQAKLKEISPLALYTHCCSHCLNLSVAASSKVQQVRNLIGLMNEAHLFIYHSQKQQRMFELYLPISSSHSKLPGLCKTNDILAMHFFMRCMRFWLLSWMQYFHHRIIQS